MSEKTAQKLLFGSLLVMILATLRLLAGTRVGAFVVALLIVAFLLWISIRAVERATNRLWQFAGAMAEYFATRNDDRKLATRAQE